MIKNIIQIDVKPGKVKDLGDLYDAHLEALKAGGDKVRSYEVFVDRKGEINVYCTKVFGSEADLQAHNSFQELKNFLTAFTELVEGGADYRECLLLTSFHRPSAA